MSEKPISGMTNTKRREIHLCCDCSQMHFLSVRYWPDDLVVYFTITVWPSSLWERMGAIWRAVWGARYDASEEVVLDKKAILDLSEFLSRAIVTNGWQAETASEEEKDATIES